jgi:hypothetical protein
MAHNLRSELRTLSPYRRLLSPSFLWACLESNVETDVEVNMERKRKNDNKKKGEIDTAAKIASKSKSKPWNHLTRVSLFNSPVLPFPLPLVCLSVCLCTKCWCSSDIMRIKVSTSSGYRETGFTVVLATGYSVLWPNLFAGYHLT